jgi:hypothetical protein
MKFSVSSASSVSSVVKFEFFSNLLESRASVLCAIVSGRH